PQTLQVWGLQNPTIPTRTPTPGPITPPPPPSATPKSGGGNPTAVPTSTTEPIATETATVNAPPTVTGTFIPDGVALPTAEPCGIPPTIQTQNPTNVRLGPGSDYAVIDMLEYLEIRLIIGRAADAAWWLIQLDDGESGWVADDVVIVQGYTGGVPIAPPPPINGHTPTPGAPWNPTPLPFCTVTPTPTAAAAVEPTATSPPAATATETVDAAPGATTAADEAPPTATNPPAPTQTAVSPPTLAPDLTESEENPTIGADTAVPPIAAPLDDAPTSSAANFFLPGAGILLIAAGVIAMIARRQKSVNGNQ
ncbi:MAG: SH3 domain-containing protein, partial [Chloroflexi bacterium]|nr:SH3 domain-containing protein [Chloroflexota bacterium]